MLYRSISKNLIKESVTDGVSAVFNGMSASVKISREFYLAVPLTEVDVLSEIHVCILVSIGNEVFLRIDIEGVAIFSIVISHHAMIDSEHWHTVCTQCLIPDNAVASRLVKQICHLARSKAGFCHFLIGIGESTALIVGTEGRAVSEDEVLCGSSSHIADDITVAFVSTSICKSNYLVLIAMHFLNTGISFLLAHQGTCHAYDIIIGNSASHDIAVAQQTIADQLACQGTRTGVVGYRLDGAVLHTHMFHDTADAAEEAYRSTLVMIHLHVTDDIAAAVIMSGKACRVIQERSYGQPLHVDVVRLQNTEFRITLQIAVGSQILQVGSRLRPVGCFLRTLT